MAIYNIQLQKKNTDIILLNPYNCFLPEDRQMFLNEIK